MLGEPRCMHVAERRQLARVAQVCLKLRPQRPQRPQHGKWLCRYHRPASLHSLSGDETIDHGSICHQVWALGLASHDLQVATCVCDSRMARTAYQAAWTFSGSTIVSNWLISSFVSALNHSLTEVGNYMASRGHWLALHTLPCMGFT